MKTHIEQMRNLASQLITRSFPLVSPQDEEAISVLKQRDVVMDGYELVVYFNMCRHNDIKMETLQVFGKYFTYLPFYLVCKVACEFLGREKLSLIEVFHKSEESSRKIYVWTVYYNNAGEPMGNPFVDSKPRTYEGFSFSHIEQNQISFF